MIDDREVEVLAKAARLTLTEEEKKAFIRRLEELLAYMDKYLTMDLNDVPPFGFVHSIHNVLREDEVEPGYDQETALANAPLAQEGFFVVPRIELL
ncbi:MAG TPA: Asp-tRNA(Asn)/Glu-tRNA(Gln) amidotransferase subunit GatC [Clostridia bacterium]|nr:Asp-tRNA(Asn)/Glu-tRNA(Gln) amidotransferase subunit GatC [Clostridia bacterium]